jgi:RimJ/RimL family protein N-acetyltransferase
MMAFPVVGMNHRQILPALAAGSLFEDLLRLADQLRPWSPDEAERLARWAAQARAALAAWWDTPLTIEEAAAWGGYSASQLRRLVTARQIRTAGTGGIPRRFVPVRPGHELPLGLDLAPPISGTPVAAFLERLSPRARHA